MLTRSQSDKSDVQHLATIRVCDDSGRRDRSLTSLPDHLIQFIISLLPTKAFLRLLCTSKTFHMLCLSTPCLTINNDVGRSLRVLSFSLPSFTRTIHRYFARRGEQPLSSLTLRWFFILNEESCYCFYSWLIIACRCGLQELNLALYHCGETTSIPYSLPGCIYQCQTLKSFSQYSPHMTHKFPFSTPFTNLESLSLNTVKFEDSRFGQWISACPTIKQIWLENVDGLTSIEIKSQSLRSFEIIKPSILLFNLSISGQSVEKIRVSDWIFFASLSRSKTLRIDAPNLKRFIWTGGMTCSVTLENLVHLQLVYLILIPNHSSLDLLYNLLDGVRMAKEIHISSNLTRVLLHEQGLTIPSFHAHSLHIYTKDTDPICLPGLVSLMRRMDKVESLHVKSNRRSGTFFRLHLFLQQLSETQRCRCREIYLSSSFDFIQQLKKVEIDITEADNELIALATYLLRHAKRMKEMIVFRSSVVPPSVINRIRRVMEAANSNESPCKISFRILP